MKKILFAFMAFVAVFAVTSCQINEELSKDEPPQAPTNELGDATDTPSMNDMVDVKWVQLWADGPKFAECNVGAENNKPEDYGGYYCWGGKYNNNPALQGFTWKNEHYTGTDALSGNDDTATNHWGGRWRMPTKSELQALIDNCDVEWTTVNGVDGRKFTGKGDYSSYSMFLPAAGYCTGSVLAGGKCGCYWSSTPDGIGSACYLGFNSSVQPVDCDSREYGFSVRAVLADE